MKKSTIFLIILFLSVPVLGIIYGVFWIRDYTGKVYKNKSCDFAVIDHIESHTLVGIPKVKDTKCEYDPVTNIKKVVFVLDTSEVNLDEYIREAHYQKLDSLIDFSFDGFLQQDPGIENQVTTGNLYYIKGAYEKETWKFLLNKVNAKLWVNLYYQE